MNLDTPGLLDLSWRDSGACRGKPSEWWLVDDHETPDPRAAKVCGGCPALSECRRHALLFEDYGFWALLTAPQRRKIRRATGVRLIDSPAAVRRGMVDARSDAGMTPREIARDLGVNVRYVYRDLEAVGQDPEERQEPPWGPDGGPGETEEAA